MGARIRARTDRSVLESALSAGLNIPHSCKSGHCASCRARLLTGEIHYPHGRTARAHRSGGGGRVHLVVSGPAAFGSRSRSPHRHDVAEAEIKTLPCRIARMERLAPDVMQVFLRLPAVEPLQFQAGQYLDVLLEDERRRSFSIASPPHDSRADRAARAARIRRRVHECALRADASGRPVANRGAHWPVRLPAKPPRRR